MAKTAFITGASRGIGKAIAARFRQDGYNVIAPTRQEMDLASVESVNEFLANNQVEADVLINNAGINRVKPAEDITLEDWQQVLNVNLTAPFLLTKAVLPYMKKNKRGRILNISSCYSIVSREGRLVYTTSKAGLNGFTKTVAVENAKYNILVNALCPGFVDTELTRHNNDETQITSLLKNVPIGRLATVEEMAEAAFFLCSDKNTYITGQSILADGGFTCV